MIFIQNEKFANFIFKKTKDYFLNFENEKLEHLERLLKNDIVYIEDKKLFLTKKAEFAIYTGVDDYLKEYPLNKKVNFNSCKKTEYYIKIWDQKRKISIVIWILLLLIGIKLRHSITGLE